MGFSRCGDFGDNLSLALFGQHRFEDFDEVFRVLKLTIDAHEAHERNLIEVKKALHKEFAQILALYFVLETILDIIFDEIKNFLNLCGTHGSLSTRNFQAVLELLTIEKLSGAIAFYHFEDRPFDSFVRCETTLAELTHASASNGIAIIASARIDDFIIILVATGTFHGFESFPACYS